MWSVGSVGRAHRSHRWGHWFESSTDHAILDLQRSGIFSLSLQKRMVSSMTKFVPRPKLSKKARKELDAQKRTTWAFSPVTKKVESKKIYNRKKAAHVWKDDSSMSGFCCTGDGAAANAICMCAFNLRRALLAVRSDAQKDYFDEESWKTFAEREQRQAVLEIILEMQQKYSHRLLTAQ